MLKRLSLFILAGYLGLFSLAFAPPKTQAAGCNQDVIVEIIIPTEGQTFSETTSSGSVSIPVRVKVFWTDTTNSPALDWVEIYTTNPAIYPNNVLLGQRYITTNQQQTPREIDFQTSSASYANGQNALFARAHLVGSGGYSNDCQSNNRSITVQKAPPDNSALMVFIEPTSLTLNLSQPGELRAFAYSYNNGTYTPLTSGVTFGWTTSFGSLTPNHDRATFLSGTVGTATVKVTGTYGAKNSQKEIFIYVNSTSSGTSGSSTGTIPTAVILCVKSAIGEVRYQAISTGQSVPTAEENDKFHRCFETYQTTIPERFVPTSTPLPPEVQSCLKLAVGAQRFYEINSGRSRPTATENEKGRGCFDKPRTTIPLSFAPIAAEKATIVALAKNSKTKIVTAKERVAEESVETKIPAIIFEGSAEANKSVYLYIFSDPKVLLAKTDENGQWSYTLEDPLDPGQHEVYVAVENLDSNFVRSDPFFIEVAQAAPSDVNPNGGSLNLESNLQSQQRLFIALAALLITVGLVAITFLRRKMLKGATKAPAHPAA